MRRPLLVVLAGLPGTGKTTLASRLAQAFGAVHLRTDAIAGPMLVAGLTDQAAEAGRVAYLIAERLARENLANGIPVVVDGVHATHERRRVWPNVAHQADVPIMAVETTVSDRMQHELRVAARAAKSGPGVEATWDSLTSMRYETWDDATDGPRLVVDMTDTAHGLATAERAVRALLDSN